MCPQMDAFDFQYWVRDQPIRYLIILGSQRCLQWLLRLNVFTYSTLFLCSMYSLSSSLILSLSPAKLFLSWEYCTHVSHFEKRLFCKVQCGGICDTSILLYIRTHHLGAIINGCIAMRYESVYCMYEILCLYV